MEAGDIIKVWDNGSTLGEKRIFLNKINGSYHCVVNAYEEDFKKGESYVVQPWKNGKEIPEQKYRPYTMTEFMKEYVEYGQTFIDKEKYNLELVSINEITIEIQDSIHQRSITYAGLLIGYTWQDGSKMGVEIE